MHPHAFVRRAVVVSTMAAALVAPLRAQDFVLQIGPPTAAAPPVVPRTGSQTGAIAETKVGKDAVLVVRPLGCANPAEARVTATAEGLLDGGRRSLAMRLVPLQAPGAHAVIAPWPDGAGVWVVSLSGTCAGRAAGAIVRLGPREVYRRDRVELVAHHPTPDEIDRALRLSARDDGPGTSGR
jgi:hypothetical protein